MPLPKRRIGVAIPHRDLGGHSQLRTLQDELQSRGKVRVRREDHAYIKRASDCTRDKVNRKTHIDTLFLKDSAPPVPQGSCKHLDPRSLHCCPLAPTRCLPLRALLL